MLQSHGLTAKQEDRYVAIPYFTVTARAIVIDVVVGIDIDIEGIVIGFVTHNPSASTDFSPIEPETPSST
jgi:hypothetical protein